MGKTFRKEKTFGHKKPKLTHHRELPDYMDDIMEGEEDYYDQLHSEKQDVERPEDESSGQADKRQR